MNISAQVRTLDLCKYFMATYVFIQDALNDILNAILFARIKIFHNLIISQENFPGSTKEEFPPSNL